MRRCFQNAYNAIKIQKSQIGRGTVKKYRAGHKNQKKQIMTNLWKTFDFWLFVVKNAYECWWLQLDTMR